MKKVFAKTATANVRPLPSTAHKQIAVATTTVGFDLIETTSVINGFKWHKVKTPQGNGYMREDVVRLVDVKPPTPTPTGKKLKYLVLHCTATPEGRDVSRADIVRWHTAPVNQGGRGWKTVGYSRLINLSGDLILLHPYNENDIVEPWEVTNGATGINSVSRHIVYAGGTDVKLKAKDTRTEAQKETMKNYVLSMVKKYPDILVSGHNQFANKACPSFDVPTWCREIGVPEKNIYKK